MIPTITDPIVRAAKEKQLKEAQDAYHSIMTGTLARVVVDQNGERVEFSSANAATLAGYISRLQTELGMNCGAASQWAVRPASFIF